MKITQESGQNSAVVIGIPGSGKSVFLHSIIMNAVVNYSPEELSLYLMDFSGVEFNIYATHNLPHARVIAPEAEREFGLSVLKELYEEGARRMNICRENEVSNIVDLKINNPSIKMPRLLIIIDEFQKIFEIENDPISRAANRYIGTIIQEFRKFGINLILATQRLPSSYILPKDLIANRVVFRSSPNDFSALITIDYQYRMPQLSTGECIYNSESGSQYDNNRVQTFYVSKKDMDKLLNDVNRFAEEQTGEYKNDIVVFRSNDLPDFKKRRKCEKHIAPCECPEEAGIYLGESVAIAQTDVCAVLCQESSDNVLIIGGEQDVAEKIAIHATLSAMDMHKDFSATFYFLNYMRQEDENFLYFSKIFVDDLPFEMKFPEKAEEVLQALEEVKAVIDERKTADTTIFHNIYINIYAFQHANVFERGGRRGDSVSEAGALLDYILKQGPPYGIYTILHVDNLMNLMRIDTSLPTFKHKVVLQMEEIDSNRVIGSSVANKLFDMNRPSSKYRCYYCDRSRNVLIKFKPYK